MIHVWACISSQNKYGNSRLIGSLFGFNVYPELTCQKKCWSSMDQPPLMESLTLQLFFFSFLFRSDLLNGDFYPLTWRCNLASLHVQFIINSKQELWCKSPGNQWWWMREGRWSADIWPRAMFWKSPGGLNCAEEQKRGLSRLVKGAEWDDVPPLCIRRGWTAHGVHKQNEHVLMKGGGKTFSLLFF